MEGVVLRPHPTGHRADCGRRRYERQKEGRRALTDPSQESGAYPLQPQVAVGGIVFQADRVLLVLRGKPPGQGMWSIPGGRVHLGESLQQAAEREIREETGCTVRALEPVYTFDVVDRDERDRIRFHYVIVDLLAQFVEGEPRAGDDALEARWVSRQELDALGISSRTRHLLDQLTRSGTWPRRTPCGRVDP